MQIKLTGEQPFQVLSTTFTIGPSTSGYDLYFSADGVNYTQLFTVGAGVNRQVTQVAAGSYYKLVGNTGNVVVNWYGNCVTDNGGGGGGGYVLPVASQSTLGGVKIGSGITIDSNGTISAQGGGAEVKTIALSTTVPADFTQEDFSAMTEMVEYLADFPVNGLPQARIFIEGTYYTLSYCEYNAGNVEEQIPERRNKYVFTYADATSDTGEYTDENGAGYIESFHLNIKKVGESYGVYWYGGTQNYAIVDDLSDHADPGEGKMAYVKEHVTNTYNGTKIYISDFQAFTQNTGGRAEDYVARIHWGDWDSATQGVEDLLVVSVYQSSANFFWGWNNNGKLNDITFERDGVNYNIKYRAVSGDDDNGSEAYFEFFPADSTPYGDYIIQYSNYVTGETVTYEEIEPGAKYTYKDEAWMKQQDSHYLFIGDPDNPGATVEERIAFYNAVKKYPGDNWYVDIYNEGLKRFEYFYTSDDGKPVFTADYGWGRRIGYALNADGSLEFYHDDRPEIPVQAFIQVDSGGTIHTDGLTNIPSEQYYRIWLRYNSQSLVNPEEADYSCAPLKYCYRQYEEISGEVKLVYYIGGEIYIGGTLYKGTWHFKEWEWGDTPLAADTWTTV